MENLDQRIGTRIRVAREDAGLTQEEVAEQLGLSSVGYGGFERGDRRISIGYLIRLCDILDRTVNYFLGMPAPECQDYDSDEEAVVKLWRQIPEPDRERILRWFRAMVRGG